ncbi:hypothetical protein GCM10009756_11550 [Pseudokineococcus marinus]
MGEQGHENADGAGCTGEDRDPGPERRRVARDEDHAARQADEAAPAAWVDQRRRLPDGGPVPAPPHTSRRHVGESKVGASITTSSPTEGARDVRTKTFQGTSTSTGTPHALAAADESLRRARLDPAEDRQQDVVRPAMSYR